MPSSKIVAIDVSRIRREVKYHHSHVYSTDTIYGFNLEEFLQIIPCLHQTRDKLAMDVLMDDLIDMLGSPDMQIRSEFAALISFIAKAVESILSILAEDYPNRTLLFDQVRGDSAFYLME